MAADRQVSTWAELAALSSDATFPVGGWVEVTASIASPDTGSALVISKDMHIYASNEVAKTINVMSNDTFTIQNCNVEIRKLNFVSDADSGAALYVLASDDDTYIGLHHCRFEATAGITFGLYLHNQDAPLVANIRNCTFGLCSSNWINLYNEYENEQMTVTIDGCDVVAGNINGFAGEDTGGGEAIVVTITNSTLLPLYVTHGCDVTYTESVITAATHHAVYVNGSTSTVTLNDCTVYGPTSGSTYLLYSLGVLRAYNCDLYSRGGTLVPFGGTGTVEVWDSYWHSHTTIPGTILFRPPGTHKIRRTILDCTALTAPSGVIIYLSNSASEIVDLEGCVILFPEDESTATGVGLLASGTSASNRVRNCTFVGRSTSTQRGIGFTGTSSRCVVDQSVFYNCSIGVDPADTAQYDSTNGHSNAFVDCGVDVDTFGIGSSDVSEAGDPFIDSLNNDYRISSDYTSIIELGDAIAYQIPYTELVEYLDGNPDYTRSPTKNTYTVTDKWPVGSGAGAYASPASEVTYTPVTGNLQVVKRDTLADYDGIVPASLDEAVEVVLVRRSNDYRFPITRPGDYRYAIARGNDFRRRWVDKRSYKERLA